MFKIREIKESEYPDIRQLIHTTVITCYPAIYPPRVVQFFLHHHSIEEIHRRATTGVVIGLFINQVIRATGFLSEGELGGVYVHPEFQRKGLGTAVVNHLLGIASKEKLNRIWLDATPIAKPMYDRLGFKLVKPMIMYVQEAQLQYYKMEKLP